MSEFVTFEIAKRLKEKGFTLPVLEIYGKFDNDGMFHSQLYCNYCETMDSEEIIAPTISQVLTWLRNKKNLYLGITYVPQIEKCIDFYFPTIQYIGEFKTTVYTKPTDNFKTYEEAALAGIEYVLNNLI